MSIIPRPGRTSANSAGHRSTGPKTSSTPTADGPRSTKRSPEASVVYRTRTENVLRSSALVAVVTWVTCSKGSDSLRGTPAIASIRSRCGSSPSRTSRALPSFKLPTGFLSARGILGPASSPSFPGTRHPATPVRGLRAIRRLGGRWSFLAGSSLEFEPGALGERHASRVPFPTLPTTPPTRI